MNRIYARTLGFSQVGDWQRWIAINWIIVADLSNPAWVSVAVTFVTQVFVTLVMMFPSRQLEQIPNRLAVSAATFCAFLGSAALATLAFLNLLNWTAIALISSALAVVVALAHGHNGRYKREIGGAEQTALSFLTSQSFSVARFIAGLSTALFAGREAWRILAFDAGTFLPFLVFSLTKKPARSEVVTVSTPISLKEGIRFATSTPRMKVLFFLSGVGFTVGNIPFAVVPEILKTQLGAGLPEYGIWLAVTGFFGLLGTRLGDRWREKGQTSTNSLLLWHSLGVMGVIGSGLAGSFIMLCLCYSLYTFLIFPVGCVIDGQQREESREHSGVVEKVRAFQQGLLGASVSLAITFTCYSMGLKPSQILIVSGALQLTAGVAAWVYVKLTGLGLVLFEDKTGQVAV